MADSKKIHDEEVNSALSEGRVVVRGNSVMWDPEVAQPSDEEVLASLGLSEKKILIRRK